MAEKKYSQLDDRQKLLLRYDPISVDILMELNARSDALAKAAHARQGRRGAPPKGAGMPDALALLKEYVEKELPPPPSLLEALETLTGKSSQEKIQDLTEAQKRAVEVEVSGNFKVNLTGDGWITDVKPFAVAHSVGVDEATVREYRNLAKYRQAVRSELASQIDASIEGDDE